MNTETFVEQLLRWRLERAEAEAPPAPRAARLLELSRPWCETWPERFQSLLERLGKIQIAYGHAMAEPRQSRSGHPVPALIVRASEEVETSARVHYLSIRDGRMRLRFQLDGAPGQVDNAFDVTFISDSTARPLFFAHASLSLDSEYRLDTEISEELASNWEQLKVTDRMPFRWILRTAENRV
jgi:hypothetical protein